MSDNINIKPETWDKYWDGNKKLLRYYKILDIFVHFWFEIGNYYSDYIHKNDKLKFIELGCGGGIFLPYFVNKYNNLDIYGIDISPKGCQSVIERIKDKVDPSNIICGDILDNEYQEQFDIVFSYGLIEHFEKPEIALKKHVELLKKGGLILCVIPNMIGLQGKILDSNAWLTKEQLQKKPKGWIFGMKKIKVEALLNWCKTAGLKDIKILPKGGFFPTFMAEGIIFKKKSRGNFLKTINRIFLLPFFALINIPTLLRMNSITFSPYIIAIGRKS